MFAVLSGKTSNGILCLVENARYFGRPVVLCEQVVWLIRAVSSRRRNLPCEKNADVLFSEVRCLKGYDVSFKKWTNQLRKCSFSICEYIVVRFQRDGPFIVHWILVELSPTLFKNYVWQSHQWGILSLAKKILINLHLLCCRVTHPSGSCVSLKNDRTAQVSIFICEWIHIWADVFGWRHLFISAINLVQPSPTL